MSSKCKRGWESVFSLRREASFPLHPDVQENRSSQNWECAECEQPNNNSDEDDDDDDDSN